MLLQACPPNVGKINLRLMPSPEPVSQRQKLRATGKGPVSTIMRRSQLAAMRHKGVLPEGPFGLMIPLQLSMLDFVRLGAKGASSHGQEICRLQGNAV